MRPSEESNNGRSTNNDRTDLRASANRKGEWCLLGHHLIPYLLNDFVSSIAELHNLDSLRLAIVRASKQVTQYMRAETVLPKFFIDEDGKHVQFGTLRLILIENMRDNRTVFGK